MRIRFHRSLVLLLLAPVGAWAQDVSSASSASTQETTAQLIEQIKQLQQQDRDLQERVRILEARQPQPSATQSDLTPAATSTPTLAEEIPPTPPPSAAPAGDVHDIHGIQWRGFGEVDYKILDQRLPELGTYGFVPGSAGNFYTGDFGLFLTSRLTARASVLSEIVFEEHDAQS
jgi:hypothetical protein